MYFHVVIHSVPIWFDQIHHLLSHFILKHLLFDTASFFLSPYYSSTPIIFHSVLSSCNTFYSKPPQSDLLSSIIFQSKTFLLQSIKFLYVQSDSIHTIKIHSILFRCNIFRSKTPQLESLSSVTFYIIPFRGN